MLVTVESDNNAVPDDFGANSPVNAGSPADLLFKGKVTIGNDGLPGVRSSSHMKLTLNFVNLDPTRRYNFRGTVSRGGNYDNRWTLFSLVGPENYVAAHVDGSKNKNIFTQATFPSANLKPNQVALNTGDNKAGSLVGWDNIEPVLGLDPNGAETYLIQISAEQYLGVSPFGNPAAAAAQYGYGFNAIYLAEVEATGSLRITENPSNVRAPAGKSARFEVSATSTLPITYQWQKAGADGVFSDIPGANAATYSTPALSVDQDGTRYRCAVASGPDHTTSGEAVLSVDGDIPTLVGATGSINFNSAYVDFSEAMDLDTLKNVANYKISGGLAITAAQVLSPNRVRLLTDLQPPATPYTITVNGVSDIAGNPVAAGSTISFTSFVNAAGNVGVEIWKGIAGGAVADLRNNARYPNDYDVDASISGLDSTLFLPSGPDNTYGGRLRAWISPEVSGDYEFFLDADDAAQLRISLEDETFDSIESAENTPIANDTTAANGFQETGSAATSALISLEAGRKYPIQVLWKESNGGDFARVAWRLSGDATPAAELKPISGSVLSYFGPASNAPQITLSTAADGKLTLSWTGKTLQSSTDLVTWQDEAGAISPLSITTSGQKFYRTRN